MLRRLVAIAALAGLPAQAADNHLSFVACPIVRDTATVPCWLTEFRGELYYLGIQTDISAEFHPPSLGHKALVEGQLSNKPRICGGLVLEPVKVSILPELDSSCNTVLPAEDQYQVPFAPRPPGPSAGRLAFADTRPPPRPEPPTPPFKAREFMVVYPFDARNVGGRETRVLNQALNYAKATGARKIEVTGYRGAAKLSDGGLITEADDIAEYRAKQVSELLRTVGGPSLEVKLAWVSTPEPADGVTDFSRRRTRIVVTP
jgi:hypothetical protein